MAPLYPGADITDEGAVRTLRGRGLGIISAALQIRRVACRAIAADLVLASTTEVGQFLTRSGVDPCRMPLGGDSHAGRHTRLRPVRPRVRGPA